MKISTKEFNLYASIINRAKNKDNSVRSNLFIDPEEGVCSCLGENFSFSFNFSIIDKNENLKPFRADITRFLAICAIYEEITIDDNYIFYGDSDKYKIYIEKEVEFDYFDFSFEDDENSKVVFNDGDLIAFSKALQFVGEEQQMEGKNMNVVHIGTKKIVSSNGSSIYENSLSKEIDFEIDINQNIANILVDLFHKDFSEIEFHYNENENGFGIKDKNDLFELIGEPATNTHVPNSEKLEEFSNSIDKTNFTFKVNKNVLGSVIDFFGVFVSNTINEPIIIEIGEKDTLIVKGTDSTDNSYGERVVSSEDCPLIPNDQIGFEFSFPRKNIYYALKGVVDTDFVTLSLGKNINDVFYFVQISSENNNDEKITSILLEV